uniref:Uncharacterized protein n=1 Tax=Acrobeloides nanus TaxID=290746 RepID=A0A914CZU3_9BILA
MDYDMREQFE